MLALPDEVIRYTIAFCNKSTRVACRLTCQKFNALLPRGADGRLCSQYTRPARLLIDQAFYDNNVGMFFLAVEWKQPLQFSITFCPNSCDKRIIRYLVQEGVIKRDDVLFRAIFRNDEELFAEYMYKGYSNASLYDEQPWLSKYMDESEFTERDNMIRLSNAYCSGKVTVIEDLLSRGYELIMEFVIIPHKNTAIWEYKRGNVNVNIERVLTNDGAEYFILTGKSVLPYITTLLQERAINCFNLALQELNATERVTRNSEMHELVALAIKYNMPVESETLLNTLLHTLDVKSLKLAEPVYGRAVDGVEVWDSVELSEEELDWLYLHYPNTLNLSLPSFLIHGYMSMAPWCEKNNIDWKSLFEPVLITMEGLTFLHKKGFDFSRINIYYCYSDETRDFVYKIQKEQGYTFDIRVSIPNSTLIRWLYRNSLLSEEQVRSHVSKEHKSVLNWVLSS